MDPNETLRLMREAIKEGDLTTAGEHAANLDYWLSRGGSLPAAWNHTETDPN